MYIVHPEHIAQLIILAPFLSLLCIIAGRVICHEVNEFFIKRCLAISQVISIAASVFTCAIIFLKSTTINLLNIGILGLSTQELSYSLQIDSTSALFVLMTCILGGIVGIFASRYLHRDSGYFRFFILYHIFLIGMHSIFQGAGLPTIYIGWELIGITSALLISFFAFRKQTVAHSLRAFWAYRITDSGILVATLLAMHEHIEQFDGPIAHAPVLIPLACLLSAIGKSAQFPFGYWLPRAMEGPTPSSAIFYGGLSVHAGMYLMIRVSETYGLPIPVSILMIVIGSISVWYGTAIGRIQSDAKSLLAYASMAQLGLMFIEIGFGLNSLAIFHFVSHAMLRTYQLLNASSLLHDRYAFEHVLGRENVSFHPINSDRAHAQYAYAFWESDGGFLGRFSLLELADLLSRAVRGFEEWLSSTLFHSARFLNFYLSHPRKKINRL
jgi:NAD(P)H-quinone oxidoreductase subunit 5